MKWALFLSILQFLEACNKTYHLSWSIDQNWLINTDLQYSWDSKAKKEKSTFSTSKVLNSS